MTAHRGTAIQIALRIEDDSCVRRGAVAPGPAEAVEHRLPAGVIQFEHGSKAEGSALERGAIKVALRVQHKTPTTVRFWSARKGIQLLVRVVLCLRQGSREDC